jgi:hypothetical protein
VLATVFGSPEHIPEQYLRRGSDIHRWTENYDLGQTYTSYQEIDRVGIYITKEGSYKLRFYDDTADFKRWNDILQHAIR